MSDRAKWLPNANPLVPPYWDRTIAYAVRAWRAGSATAEQQKLAFDWLMYVTTAAPEHQDLVFRPDITVTRPGNGAEPAKTEHFEGRRLSDVADGKRFVGLQVLKMFSPAVDDAIEREMTREAASEKRAAKEERRPL